MLNSMANMQPVFSRKNIKAPDKVARTESQKYEITFKSTSHAIRHCHKFTMGLFKILFIF